MSMRSKIYTGLIDRLLNSTLLIGGIMSIFSIFMGYGLSVFLDPLILMSIIKFMLVLQIIQYFFFNSNYVLQQNNMGIGIIYGLLSSVTNGFYYGLVFVIGQVYGNSIVYNAFTGATIVFFISFIYGYVTSRDLRSLNSIITVIGICLMVHGLLGLFLSGIFPVFFSFSSIIASFMSIILSVLCISYTINQLRQMFLYTNNNTETTLLQIIGATVLASAFLNLLMNILYLLMRLSNRSRD